MMALRIFLIGLLIAVAIRFLVWGVRYVQRLLFQDTSQDSGRSSGLNEMVRDPVCGVYVSVSEALSVATDHGNLYFCSQKCRQRFLSAQR